MLVGNGEHLKCVGQCTGVEFVVQDNTFISDFFVIDLHGADAVLGVAWQESFGELKLNFQQSYIKFNKDGKEVCLQGTQTSPYTISVNHLYQLHKKKEIAQCYLLQLI